MEWKNPLWWDLKMLLYQLSESSPHNSKKFKANTHENSFNLHVFQLGCIYIPRVESGGGGDIKENSKGIFFFHWEIKLWIKRLFRCYASQSPDIWFMYLKNTWLLIKWKMSKSCDSKQNKNSFAQTFFFLNSSIIFDSMSSVEFRK